MMESFGLDLSKWSLKGVQGVIASESGAGTDRHLFGKRSYLFTIFFAITAIGNFAGLLYPERSTAEDQPERSETLTAEKPV
jgi:hypothetical protein